MQKTLMTGILCVCCIRVVKYALSMQVQAPSRPHAKEKFCLEMAIICIYPLETSRVHPRVGRETTYIFHLGLRIIHINYMYNTSSKFYL